MADKMSVDELAGKYQKQYGENIGGKGFQYPDAERIPSGIFPLDFCLGGGFPRSGMSEIFGIEGSCKSNIAALTMAQAQQRYPNDEHVWVDVEHSYSKKWHARLGVDVDNLYVMKPSYAEHVVDIVDGLLDTSNIGLIVVDSLGVMVSLRESEKSAEIGEMGGPLLIRRFVNKVLTGLSAAWREGRQPTVIFINQMRNKMVMMGNPETTPGGFAAKHNMSIRLKTYAKPVMDTKVNSQLPIKKLITCSIMKYKVPVLANHCEFEMAMIPHEGHESGWTNDLDVLWGYLTKHEIIAKTGQKWMFNDQTFPTQKAIAEYIRSQPGLQEALETEVFAIEQKLLYPEKIAVAAPKQPQKKKLLFKPKGK